MENGETTQDAARRESLEEAQAEVQVGSLLAVVHVLHADQVHVMYRADLPKAEFGVSPESLEVMLCDEADVPWEDIAFRSVDYALRRYFEDRRAGIDRHHITAIDLRPRPDR
jgi:8-oxo-dGTP pyrophosphatase MutT (NUDIX family)